MAEIHITGQKTLKRINTEFQENFPYLFLSFCTVEDWEKANNTEGGGEIYPFDENMRLSEVRVKKESPWDISIHGRTLVKNLEKIFLDNFGICCQVGMSWKGNGMYTGEGYKKLSLTQLNRELESKGYDKKPKLQ